MARLTRLALAGQLHHVALRGHSGAPVFGDDADRREFLQGLHQAAAAHDVAVHAYALLESEVQALLTPTQAAGLGRAMQSLGRRYVRGYNRRHGRSGTLWEGRFRSSVLEPASWLLPAIVYIETLPVLRGLAAAPADWAWSSAGAHIGLRRNPVLTDHPAYWSIGNTPFDRERAHADFLSSGVTPSQIDALERALRRGHALGGAAFLDRLQKETLRPLSARPRGRPRSA